MFSQQPIGVLFQHCRPTFNPESHLTIERIVEFGRGSEIDPRIDDYLSDPFCAIANQVTVSIKQASPAIGISKLLVILVCGRKHNSRLYGELNRISGKWTGPPTNGLRLFRLILTYSRARDGASCIEHREGAMTFDCWCAKEITQVCASLSIRWEWPQPSAFATFMAIRSAY